MIENWGQAAAWPAETTPEEGKKIEANTITPEEVSTIMDRFFQENPKVWERFCEMVKADYRGKA